MSLACVWIPRTSLLVSMDRCSPLCCEHVQGNRPLAAPLPPRHISAHSSCSPDKVTLIQSSHILLFLPLSLFTQKRPTRPRSDALSSGGARGLCPARCFLSAVFPLFARGNSDLLRPAYAARRSEPSLASAELHHATWAPYHVEGRTEDKRGWS